jgi:predicted DNA-binding protein
MPHISLRVSETEKEWLENYAKLRGGSLSDAVKEALFEKLEDEYDLYVIREYEKEKKIKFYPMNDVSKDLGLETDEL